MIHYMAIVQNTFLQKKKNYKSDVIAGTTEMTGTSKLSKKNSTTLNSEVFLKIVDKKKLSFKLLFYFCIYIVLSNCDVFFLFAVETFPVLNIRGLFGNY